MPVTIHPAPHGANAFTSSSPSTSSLSLLQSACAVSNSAIKNNNIIQSSFSALSSTDNIYPSNNGFVNGALTAYSQHHHLIIRPDDIWLAILSQLNIYINAHAEELRDMFVSHAGQKELEMLELGDIKGTATFGVDWGKFSFKMTKMIAANIKDPSLREWILPCFSTTTKNDQAVASIMMMATLQKYFSYSCPVMCGLPSVTLLGQKSDWEALALKAARLPTFGAEPTIWYTLLKPVLANFTTSFTSPSAPSTLDFWQKIADHRNGGSGSPTLSGWLTAFIFWNAHGKALWDALYNPPGGYMSVITNGVFVLDSVRFHTVDTDQVPAGWAEVPVKLDDDGMIIPCVMVAGSVGVRISRSRKKTLLKREGELDTLMPESGWWMYESTGAKKGSGATYRKRTEIDRNMYESD